MQEPQMLNSLKKFFELPARRANLFILWR